MKGTISFFKNLSADPKKKFLLINYLLFFIFLALNLSVTYKEWNWTSFPDCYNYLDQSKISFLDPAFFFPTKELIAFPRAFSVPLVYKLCNSHPETIVIVQKIIYSLSVAFFIYTVGLLLRTTLLKYAWSILAYLIFSNWENLGWTQVLLSESLGLSFFLLWLGTFIRLERKASYGIWLFHFIVTVLLCFSRDNMPYFILAFYFCHILLKWLLKERLTYLLFSFALLIAVFFIHNHSVNMGERYRLPLVNTIITRIIPDETYTSWFIERGMPLADSLRKNFKDVDPLDQSREKVYRMYGDSMYTPFFKWVTTEGKSAYMLFMLTHPSYFFLIHEKEKNLNAVFLNDNVLYYGPRDGYSVFSSACVPVLRSHLSLLLLIPVLVFLFRSRRVFIKFVFALLMLSVMILLNYNADTFEVGRHMYLNRALLELLLLAGILFSVDIRTQVRGKVVQ